MGRFRTNNKYLKETVSSINENVTEEEAEQEKDKKLFLNFLRTLHFVGFFWP